MDRAIAPVGEARNDFDIFRALARRAGTEEAFTEGREENTWLRYLYDRARQQAAEVDLILPSYDEFWETGYAETPRSDRPMVLLEAFRTDPETAALSSPSGKIEIFSEVFDGFGYNQKQKLP